MKGLQKNSPKLKLYLQRSSPTILTCLAAIGVVATTVMAVRATPKAVILIRKNSRINHDGDPEAYTKLEAVQSAWKCYIPAAIIGVSTITCIFGANILNKRQQASIASTYALVNNAYREYKSKVKELYGEETHNAIIDSIAKEQCKEVHISAPGLFFFFSIDIGEEMYLLVIRTFYVSFSKQYFETTIAKVIEAEYHLNRNFMFTGVISLNDFYEFLGLEKIDIGDNIGWSSCDGDIYWIDFNHHLATFDDGLEIYVVDMVFEPTSDFLADI